MYVIKEYRKKHLEFVEPLAKEVSAALLDAIRAGVQIMEIGNIFEPK